jgi:phosphatidylserine/phosphatidylglycerophosphate/cardiolipin synthase-like enzyme
VLAGRYHDATATPGGGPFAIHEGETSVGEQYLAAIEAARRTIYLENQFIASPAILVALAAALDRGVEIVFLVPAMPMAEFCAQRRDPRAAAFFAQLSDLGRHPHFTLAGLAASCGDGRYEDVYVHAKAALVDDVWGTIGSTNVLNRSFQGDTELNASFWDAGTARNLRSVLFREHLGLDTGTLDDRAALARFREIAHANRARRERRQPLAGLAFALDPVSYGL